jgi:hypothetical protein
MMININNQRKIDNQTYVKHILQLTWEENPVDVETDSSYNNRPQPGCEVATQIFCLLVEQCTMKKLTINIETANANCKYINKIGKKRKFYKKQELSILNFSIIF